jgi:predicted nucleotide-binding protein
MASEKKVVVFYAWQTDSPEKTNRRAIRNALQSASTKLKKKFAAQKITFDIQEATRGESGSPNIPQTILKKIEDSDIFVCDLTTAIKQTSPTSYSAPNPNVVFELGFAVAPLGWPRIIMLFNEAFGEFPDDLPFDIDRYRASPYRIDEGSNTDKASTTAVLEPLLVEALKAILKTAPAKPAELKGLSVEQVHRTRDMESLRWLLSTVHWPTLDQHIDDGPSVILDRTCDFWEAFNSVIGNSLFHIYNPSLRSKVNLLHKLWGKTLSYDSFYNPSRRGDRYIFDMPMDVFRSPEHRKVWNDLKRTYPKLRKAQKAFLKEVREKYPELDLAKLNKNALDEYREFLRKIAESFKEPE